MAGRDFWHHLRECMGRLGFTSSRADPDVWFRLSKRSTGEEYYDYVLLYVDDVLVISEKAEAVLREIVLIRRAKYGGKVASRDFWHHLRGCMVRLGFTSSRADNGV